MPIPFRNRIDAGRQLGSHLASTVQSPNVLVLALPRGGVPVALEVSRALHAPLDVFLVRKLGVPGQEELAMGAIASGGVRFLNEDVVRALRISPEIIDAVTRREQQELERREQVYREGRPSILPTGKTAVLVDDGLATGSTMKAAVKAVRQQNPAHLIVAVPVAAASTCEELRAAVDDVVCLETPEPFYAVGAWYDDFSQTTDEEIEKILEQAHESVTAGPER